MRRKSERTTTKKPKASPEKKVEKPKRGKPKRRRQSSSSDTETRDEGSPARATENLECEKKPVLPQTPAKEDIAEDAQDQVWQVKTAEGSGDVGEIQKLKICLTRPPSTPERVDRSPRSKRKHTRATSSSDTPSFEITDERKKTKHRKRGGKEKDDSEKNDSHGDDQDDDVDQEQMNPNNEVTQSESTEDSSSKDTEMPVSTTNEEEVEGTAKVGESSNEVKDSNEISQNLDSVEKVSDADTTVDSTKEETQDTPVENAPISNSENPSKQSETDIVIESAEADKESDTRERERSVSIEKSEVLELHADESKCESSDNEVSHSKEEYKEDTKTPQEEQAKEQSTSVDPEVSKTEEMIGDKCEVIDTEINKTVNEHDVVESSNIKEANDNEIGSDNKVENKDEPTEKSEINCEPDVQNISELQPSESLQSTQESIVNGQPPPVVGRKRRWGSRTSKLTTQKSITISTDVLKEIIPDVKPVEFDEVIEEKKHKREREVTEKVYRPILPKIVIDNTDNVEQKKEEVENKEIKPRDLASNRKISIIKDNDSIITRPPSPPRNKQSCILYITNLVRPFTLTQLKNLLQRTGKIVENGFWIDRIKSKCFVQYESEDHAVETRHALHGVTWPVSNPKTLQVDFSTEEAFEKAKNNEEADNVAVATKPGTVEDWLREQDMKRERGEVVNDKPWERKTTTREWDLGKNEKDKDKEKLRIDERHVDKRRRRSPEKSPEPARKFKKKEEEAPAKLLDDLFRKTKTTPCIYWLPLSTETIAIKEEQRRKHMAEHERRLQEIRRTHRRH